MSTMFHRRAFTQGAAALGAFALLKATGSATVGANERVRLGVIGVGNRGDQLLDAFQVHQDAEVIAVCDVYEPYISAALQKVGGKVRAYRDYRKLLDQRDIDAVVIATPDHWHALQFVDACRAGKDVYVEKPLSLTIAEGRKMVDVAEQTGRITQVGLHRRSSPLIREAVGRIRSGEIGKVTVVRCSNLRNEFPLGIGSSSDCDPPTDLDWDMWLGPAPKVPYNPNRCLYKFRWFWSYSGGQVTNNGAHYLDIAQWALGRDAPRSVFAAGGKYAVADNREIPDTLEAIWQYDGPTLVTFSQHNANGSPGNSRGWEIEFQGTEGTLGIRGDKYEVVSERIREQELPALSPLDRAGNSRQGSAVRQAREPLTASGSVETALHARDFLDAVKNRQPASCPVYIGHRSTTATLLANIALRVGRQVGWDATREQVAGDEDANRWLSYEYRSPWKLT